MVLAAPEFPQVRNIPRSETVALIHLMARLAQMQEVRAVHLTSDGSVINFWVQVDTNDPELAERIYQLEVD
jgi:hypothetical protein